MEKQRSGQMGSYLAGQKARADGKKPSDNPHTEGEKGGHFAYWNAGHKGDPPPVPKARKPKKP